jgi:hypothetical protein
MSWLNLTAKELHKIVNKLSLEPGAASRRGPHAIYWYEIDGIKQLRIALPNIHGGSGSISTGFLKQIRNNLKLDSKEFEDLVDCPLTADEFEEIVRKKISRG